MVFQFRKDRRKRRFVGIRFDDSTFNLVEDIARSENKDISSTIRKLIFKALRGKEK